jgi:hypothetical protein
MEDIPTLCNTVIPTIVNKAKNKLEDTLQRNETAPNKKSAKRYHQNLKSSAGLQPRARDQPILQTIRDPVTNEITTNPHTVISTIQSYYEKEHSRTTPDYIPAPP